VKSVCYQPTQTCKTVGDLKRLLEEIPDDMPLKPSTYAANKLVIARFEHEKDNQDNKWITLTGGGYW
jgi:hypothetical protein